MIEAAPLQFTAENVLKRDVFSETRKGHFEGDPERKIIRREVGAAPVWSRPLAWLLARREIRVMRAVDGVPGTPNLISVDADGLYRTWVEGTPLHLARPHDPAWYKDAHRLLRSFRRRGVTHNDLAKPQNWLAAPDGSAAVIDFQLASLHRRKGALYRLMAYEDFRHLLKQKRAFAPELMTRREKGILARRSLPSRIWMASGKKVYNLITRGLFNWSDGEGTGDRLDREGAGIVTALKSHPGVRDVALTLYPLPRKGVGIYAFVEADGGIGQAELEGLQKSKLRDGGADLIQPVNALPRRPDGAPRDDILRLVAMNQMTELDAVLQREPDLAAIVQDVAAGRLNFTDRRISGLESRD
ncbi:serine/threonine protein kinase [Mesorhizobium xinjiangense]|uniref:serine/threonine protein kinase n=1 Tax=Mesorhizobium xinjiangense TaxID=2678685 RepID=UPI0012ECBDC3|nr:serine/threonine protein kinase [Mesorhizobium xinjiangense]